MADAKLACSKNILDTVSTSLNREIEKFGIYRQTILENTVGRFKRDMKIIGKQVKDNAYSIPYELEIAKLADVTLNEVEFSSEQIFRITTNVSKVTIACTNKVFEMIGKRKRINIDGYNSPNRNSGNGWFDIVIAAVELLGTIAEKKMQEEAEVKRYVAETDVLCKKVDMQTEFCRQILKRIEEIILVSLVEGSNCSGSFLQPDKTKPHKRVIINTPVNLLLLHQNIKLFCHNMSTSARKGK